MLLPQAFSAALLAAAALGSLSLATKAHALMPAEVLVVANANAPHSVELARFYARRRGIPDENLVTLAVSDAESCSRKEYDEQIAEPVRRRLHSEGGKAVRAVALVRGVPLRVEPPELPAEDLWAKARLKLEEKELLLLGKAPLLNAEEKGRAEKKLAGVRAKLDAFRRDDEAASVDSELSLVRAAPYELKGWLANPLFAGAGRSPGVVPKEEVLLVSRLDGPTEAVVRRVVDDTLAVEGAGLQGTAYLDARWKDPGNAKALTGYELWDQSLHEAARALKQRGIPVVLDDAEALFPEGSRLPAALYCGWYSLSRYVGAFAWRRGAVGYHIASGECVTLREGPSQAWCKRMLEEGVAATLGPVGEPYVQAFPPPHLFFPLLLDGRLTLVEAYYASLPHLSWKMVLVGDPLYRPFAGKPAAK